MSAGLVADREGELVSEHAEGAGRRATVAVLQLAALVLLLRTLRTHPP